jgi:hypothetical protein
MIAIDKGQLELEEGPILGCFPEDGEFGFGGRHALGLEQEIAEILVP